MKTKFNRTQAIRVIEKMRAKQIRNAELKRFNDYENGRMTKEEIRENEYFLLHNKI
tara:strand:- start:52 stop:219 length:168 start_codon:yes stop_codon:yes gene_type:complete